MWQVNGFDRRCFQLGRGFRISPGAVTAVTSHEGSLEAALEAADHSIDLARGKGHLDALAESLQQKVKLQCQAYQRLDDSQDLKAAEQQIEKEAANFHQANFSKGVALMRISLAHIDLQRGGLCRCSSAAELALDAMSELTNEDPAMLEAQLLRATALLACGDPRAQADAHDVLEKSRRLGDRRWEAHALHVFGLSKAFQGTFSAYEDALRSLSDAQRLCFDLQIWRSHIAVELSMARLYLESQQPQEAIRIAEEALVLIQDMGDFHSEYIAYGLLCQAILDTDSNVSQAQVRAREAVERFRVQGPRPHALALNLLAGVLSEMGDPQSANYVVQDALVICRKLQDAELEAQILLRLSSIEAANDQDDATLQALETAIKLYQRLPETSEAIACARYLSISVLLRMFDPKESLKEASQVRAFFAEEKDAHREAMTLVAVASISFTRNDLEDAKESLELARELFSGVADVRGELLALTTLAEMHRSNGEISEASQLMQRCRAMAKEAFWKDEEVRILVDLSNLQRTETSVKSSARLAREGLRMAKQIGNLEGQAELLMQCVQCNLLLASEKLPSRNLLEETQRLAADAVRLTADGVGWRRRLKGLALYWQAHSIALKDTTEALKHLEALVDFCRSKENVGLEAHTRLLEAQIYLSRDKAKALEILRPAAETLKKLGDVNGMEMAEQVLQRASPPKQPARPVSSDSPPALMDVESPVVVSAVSARGKLDMTSVRKLILDLATDAVASDEPLHDDTVLMDSGMDSLTSVAFRNDLQSKLNVDLPASLIFEYPSVGELTRLVMSLSDQ